jgi:hypothetical protein
VLSNFSIIHSPAPSGSPASDFSFPYVQSLLVDNVCVSNSNNVFDLGEHTSTVSYSSVTVRDSSCGFSYSGHFMALHGTGSNISVYDNSIVANATGIVLDTSDLTNGTYGAVNSMSWVGNTIEQPFIGMFQFGGGPQSGSTATTITSSQWKGNVYDNCVLYCYYFGLDSYAAPAPLVGGFKLSDRSATSRYDALDFDGGLASTGGVQTTEVGGPSFYSGSNGGTASSVILLRGTPSPGDQVWIVWSGSNYVQHNVTTTSSDTPNSIASALAHSAAASPIAQQANLANPGYGIIGVSMTTTPPPGSYAAQPYEVIINSSQIRPIGLPTASAYCLPPGGTSSYPCWTGAFDVGDGAAIRNRAHDIDIVGAGVISQAGAGIHVWLNGGDQLHFLKNVLGMDQGTTSYTGLQFDGGGRGAAEALERAVKTLPIPDAPNTDYD